MDILITLPTSEEVITIKLTDTPVTLKKLIAEQEGLQLKSFDLLFNGSQLTGTKNLSSFGLESMSNVEVVISDFGNAERLLGQLLGGEKPTNTHFSQHLNKSDFDTIKLFIDYGKSVNESLNGRAPIHRLVIRGDIDILKKYMALPDVNVSCTDRRGNTVLGTACQEETPFEIIEMLAQIESIDVNARNSRGRTPFSLVCGRGSISNADIEKLIRLPRLKINAKSKVTPMQALLFLNSEMLQERANLLLSNGYIISDNEIATACKMSSLEIVKMLFSRCKPKTKKAEQKLYEGAASNADHGVEVLQFLETKLKSKPNLNGLLLLACDYSCNDMAKYVVERGANINYELKPGDTPLASAVDAGNVSLVRWFLSICDEDLICSGRPTPMEMAVESHHTEIFSLLLRGLVGEGINELFRRSSVLEFAIEIGTVEDVAYILSHEHFETEHGLKTNMVQRSLFLAASEGRGDVMSLLINDERFMQSRKHLQAAFLAAVSAGSTDCVRVLLPLVDKKLIHLRIDRGANSTPLNLAVSSGFTDMASLIASHPDCCVNVVGHSRPLHSAVLRGFLDIVQILCLHPKININELDHTGWSPFSHAIAKGYIDIVKYLSQLEGIDVNWGHKSAISTAIFGGHKEVIEYLLADERVNLSHHSIAHAASGKSEYLKMFLDSGRNVDFQVLDDKNNPPLFTAIMSCAASVEMLLSIPKIVKDINKQYNWTRNTALHVASVVGHDSVMEKLLAVPGIDVNISNFEGTPLMSAVMQGNVAKTKMLLEAKADVNIQNADGETSWTINALDNGEETEAEESDTFDEMDPQHYYGCGYHCCHPSAWYCDSDYEESETSGLTDLEMSYYSTD
eukprot:TRINITY_DN2966_c0_g1_i1.p1 TRINITY_DN2966_c0_g1~~TRINITY_DN2966_c0_g1_i1.p1  ORF type:complete len:878 (+),score=162.46 TRINITY_DN2966_c0_g1_i1:80-2635(+)